MSKRARNGKRKLRVLVLMHETLVPPETASPQTRDNQPWKTEYDVTTALRKMGHEAHPLGVGSDLGVLRDAIAELKPHLTFNLLEEFHGVAVYDQHVVSYLELMKRRYTGCSPRGLMLAHDKALSKQILSYHRVPVPDFAVFPMGRRVHRPKHLSFPLLVKSLTAEGSVGIAEASVVHDDAELKARTEFVHEKLATDAIAEQYIDGRELYVGVMGNQRLRTLPIWEMSFEKRRDDAPFIATERAKWDPRFQERRGVVWGPVKEMPEGLEAKIHRLCVRAYRYLSLTGYGRIDLRLTPDGKIYVLEANPNPDLARDGEFAEAAESAKIKYEELLRRIIALGVSYRAQWQG